VYFVHLHIVGKIQFYQTFMGTQNKYGILYGDKIWGFLVYFTILFFSQHKVLNFRNFMDIIHLPPFSHNKHQNII
jgi:hypothetical protein